MAEAVRIELEAAGGKNLEVLSPTIGRQLLDLGLIDEIDLHIALPAAQSLPGVVLARAVVALAAQSAGRDACRGRWRGGRR